MNISENKLLINYKSKRKQSTNPLSKCSFFFKTYKLIKMKKILLIIDKGCKCGPVIWIYVYSFILILGELLFNSFCI